LTAAEPRYCLTLRAPAAAELVYAPSLTAAELVEGLEPGARMVGVTRGQFSLFQLVMALLDRTGPADVSITTWSVGPKDLESAAQLLEGQKIRAYRMLVSQRWLDLKPRSVARMLQLFGDGAVVVSQCHAKCATIRNEEWDLVLRSSANMNTNPRFEQFDLDDDHEIADFVDDWITELQELGMGSFHFTNPEKEAVFKAALSSTADREVLAEMLGEDAVRRRERALARERVKALAAAELFGGKAPAPTPSPALVAPGEGAARPSLSSGLAGLSREEALVWQLRAAELGVAQGEAGSVAYIQALKHADQVHQALTELRERERPEEGAAELTEEEWLRTVREHALEVPDQELEVYLHQWLQRKGLRMVVEAGEPRLVRVRAG